MKKTMSVPAMSGLDSSGQLTFNGNGTTTTTRRSRMADPYTICNIGKRIWNPLTQDHCDYPEFYRLIREDNIDLSLLKINSHINVGTQNGKHKFDGSLSETEWMAAHDLLPIGTNLEPVGTVVANHEIDQITQVCANQAVEIDRLNTELKASQKTLSRINGRLEYIRKNAADVLCGLDMELGIEEDVPF